MGINISPNINENGGYRNLTWVLVALGGAIGSLLRFSVGRFSSSYFGTTLLGTLAVNVTGSFALGFLLGLTWDKPPLPYHLRNFLAVGLLGGYTTFSTLTVESLQLLDSGSFSRAAINILSNMIIGLLAAYLGILLGKTI
jgi:CrcB protein